MTEPGNGYYRMHRGWMDNPALGGAREPFCRRAAWAWLIENAQWRAAKIDIGGRTETVERGQLSYSFRYLAKAWNWSIHRVQLFIERLETDTMINTATGTGRLIITICNYEKYQASADFSGTASGTVVDTLRVRDGYESKESNNTEHKNGVDSGVFVDSNPPRGHAHACEENTPPPPPPVHDQDQERDQVQRSVIPFESPFPLPDDWRAPPEWIEWARSLGHPDPEYAESRFREYWLGKRDRRASDALNTARSWARYWRGWIERDLKVGVIYGTGRNTDQRRRDGGLAAVILSDIERGFGNAKGGSDGW